MNNENGQTILEVIIATGIIIVVLGTLLSGQMMSLRFARNGQKERSAFELAREGIEVVRGIRDTNWIVKQEWSLGLTPSSGSEGAGIFIFDPQQSLTPWRLAFDEAGIEKERRVYDYVYQPQGRSNGYHVFRQYDAQSSGDCMQTEFFCRHFSIRYVPLGNSEDEVMFLTSTVEWKQGSNNKKVELEALFYDWR